MAKKKAKIEKSKKLKKNGNDGGVTKLGRKEYEAELARLRADTIGFVFSCGKITSEGRRDLKSISDIA